MQVEAEAEKQRQIELAQKAEEREQHDEENATLLPSDETLKGNQSSRVQKQRPVSTINKHHLVNFIKAAGALKFSDWWGELDKNAV